MTEEQIKGIQWSNIAFAINANGMKAIFLYGSNAQALDNVLRSVGYTISLHKEHATQLYSLKFNFNSGGYIIEHLGLYGTYEPIEWLIRGDVGFLYVVSTLDNTTLPAHRIQTDYSPN